MGDKAAHILPGGQGVWDTGQIMFSVRRDDFGRLIVGSMGKILGAGRGLSHKWAKRRVKKLFPELGDVAWETCWDGRIAMTPDHLPRIHELAPNVIAAMGYNGRGITTGTVFGRCLANRISAKDPKHYLIAPTPMKTVARAPVMSRLYETAFKVNQLYKSL